jgi:transposase
MKYSQTFQRTVLRRVLPPNKESVYALSEELNLSPQTIYSWIKKAENGNFGSGGDIAPNKRSVKEKFRLLINSKSISENKLGEWLRSNGLHSEHLHQYEQEISDIMTNKTDKFKKQQIELIKENKELKRKNRRQEKALAELAALLTLKKKAQIIWGEGEDE